VLSFKIKKDFFLIQLKTDNFKLKTRQPLAGAGGGERIRTDDLLRARQALSQLSYTPGKKVRGSRFKVNRFYPF
jgi:hypothetical protein